jgi:4-aminobutyrate aminotransferase/(S)-3-amino-2-methylpropionate transaminase
MDAPGDNAIGGTYVGNPVACAAANAVLDVIEEEELAERAERLGKDIRSRWEEVGEEVSQIGEIRGVGAMIGVEFVEDQETKEPAREFTSRVVGGAMERGVVSISCGIHKNVLRHLMPLVITDEELAEGLDVLAEAATSARAPSAKGAKGEGE